MIQKHKLLIHIELKNTEGYTFHMIALYGEGMMVKKRDLWDEIRHIGSGIAGKEWVMEGGNFNEILKP